MNTIDIDNINLYVEHHPDKGCELYGECESCPFGDCLHQQGRQALIDERERIREVLRHMNKMLRRKVLWVSWK